MNNIFIFNTLGQQKILRKMLRKSIIHNLAQIERVKPLSSKKEEITIYFKYLRI